MSKDAYKKYVKGPGESDGLHVDRATFHSRKKHKGTARQEAIKRKIDNK